MVDRRGDPARHDPRSPCSRSQPQLTADSRLCTPSHSAPRCLRGTPHVSRAGASITAATTGTAGAIVGSMICLSTDLSGTDTLRVLTARAEGSSAFSATFRGADEVIPACAGSNCRASCRARLGGGYPRVRGEQRMRMVSVGPYWGSSPHALGAVLDFGEGAAVGGVIPVCAGSRHWHAAGARGLRGHPRLRGEQSTGTRS